MKTIKLSHIIMLMFAFGILFGCGEKIIDYAKAEPELSIKAKRLYNDFSKNEELANEKYLNKFIQIDGILSRIEPLGDTSVVLVYNYGFDDDEYGIRVTMLPETRDAVKTLSKKYNIHIKGVCTGFDGTNVLFEKGSLAK